MTRTIEIELSEEAAGALEAIAAHRGCSQDDLARAYIDDWLEVDSAELKGRSSRNAVYRDHRLTIDERLFQRRTAIGDRHQV